MKRFEASLLLKEGTPQTEVVVAEQWSITSEGRLQFVIGDKRVAEFNKERWGHVHELAEEKVDSQADLAQRCLATFAKQMGRSDNMRALTEREQSAWMAVALEMARVLVPVKITEGA